MSAVTQVPGGLLSDIITWVRRIIKSPSAQAISNQTIADYINRFVVYEMAERFQLNEFKRQYTFETVPNIFVYQAPFTHSISDNFPINTDPPPFINNPVASLEQTVVPVYQNFRPPVYADGIQLGFFQSNDQFYRVFPEFVQNQVPMLGDGTVGPYSTTITSNPILRGFIDDIGYLQPYVFITTVSAAGTQQYIVDSGYVNPLGEGILIQTDATFQNITGSPLTGSPPSGGGAGTVDYNTGEMTFTFSNAAVDGANINVQTSPYSAGFPRIMLFFNNYFKIYPVPDKPYKIQIDAMVTPQVFFNTSDSFAFAYMSEYIARGAARKILSDNGDWEQFAAYEGLFREQENLVLRRTDRQRGIERTPTIFTASTKQNAYMFGQF